jgi:hypothetical protein
LNIEIIKLIIFIEIEKETIILNHYLFDEERAVAAQMMKCFVQIT